MRVVRKQAAPAFSRRQGAASSSEIREEKIDRRSRKNSRRDQVVPVDSSSDRRMNLRKERSKRRSAKERKALRLKHRTFLYLKLLRRRLEQLQEFDRIPICDRRVNASHLYPCKQQIESNRFLILLLRRIATESLVRLVRAMA